MPTHDPDPATNRADIEVGRALERLRRGHASAKNDLFNVAIRQFERMARKLLRRGDFEDVRRWEQTDDIVQGLCLRMSRAIDNLVTERLATPGDFFRLAGKNIRWELQALRERYSAAKRPGQMLETNFEPDAKGGPPTVGRKVSEAIAPDDWEIKVSRYLEVIEGASEEDRDVLDLVFVNGLTGEEAAGALEVSLATFKRRYLKARMWLGGQLKDPRDT